MKRTDTSLYQEPNLNTSKRLIVVLGMHRSGTSTVTRGLQVLGVDLGESLMAAAAENNERGFWEDTDINGLCIEMLYAIAKDWDCVTAVTPQEVDWLCACGYLQKAQDMLALKLANTDVFGFKNPRVAYLLPFWNRVFERLPCEVAYIIAIRNPLSVVRSLAARDRIDRRRSYLLWLEYVIRSLAENNNGTCVLIDYDNLMQAPAAELGRMSAQLDLNIQRDELQRYEREFIDAGLRHSIHDPQELLRDKTCPRLVFGVYTRLLGVAADLTTLDDPAFARQVDAWSQALMRQQRAFSLLDRLFKPKRNLPKPIRKLPKPIRRKLVPWLRNLLLHWLRARLSLDHPINALR